MKFRPLLPSIFALVAIILGCKSLQDSALKSPLKQKGSWQTLAPEVDLGDSSLEAFRVCGEYIRKDCLEFAPNTTSFTWSNAVVLSLLSHIVYDKDVSKPDFKTTFAGSKKRETEKSRELVKAWGFDSYDFYTIGTNEYAIVQHADFIVVVFRGSSTFWDWIQNYNAANLNVKKIGSYLSELTDFVGHNGYIKAADAILEKRSLAAKIKELQPDSQRLPVWFTGHSKGGAIAIATAVMMEAKHQEGKATGGQIDRVVTFGAPKLLGEQLSKFYQKKIPHSWRVIYNKDPVVAMPRFFGLIHKKYEWEADQIFLSRDGCKQLEHWPLRHRPFPVIGPGLLERGLLDHRLRHYIQCSHKQLHEN